MNLRRASVCIVVAAAAASPSWVAAQTVRERVAVEVITIRLTARDASGKRVEDLSPSDLVLTVDGKPVAIETFVRPSAPGASVAAAEGEPGDSADRPSSSAQPRLVRTLIFIDEGQTNAFDRKDVLDELDGFIRAPDSGRREFLVARFDGSRLKMESPWTSDAGLATAAVGRIRQGPAVNRIPSAGQVAADTAPNRFTSATWISHHGEHLHEALLEALAAFPNEPAERRLLIVSGGASLMRPTDLAAVLACRMTPGESARLSAAAGNGGDIAAAHAREIDRATFALWSRAVNPSGGGLTMSEILAKAVERDVAVIPVEAEAFDRGDMDLSVRQMTVASAGGVGQTCPVGGIGVGGLSPRLAVGQTMTEIAESTGAEPILVPKKTAARLTEIGGRAVYAMTFRDPTGDHRYHQVEVACRRPGVKIEYRRGYRIPGEDERTLDAVVARFLQPGQGSDPMAVSILQSSTEGKGGRAATRLDIRYSPPLETGAHDEREIQLIAVGEDGNGNRTEPIAWSGTAHREAEASTEFAAKVTLGIPPGAFGWSVAVRDQPTGLTSYVFVPALGKP